MAPADSVSWRRSSGEVESSQFGDSHRFAVFLPGSDSCIGLTNWVRFVRLAGSLGAGDICVIEADSVKALTAQQRS